MAEVKLSPEGELHIDAFDVAFFEETALAKRSCNRSFALLPVGTDFGVATHIFIKNMHFYKKSKFTYKFVDWM